MKKIAVFIDRDGVINEEISFITKPAQIKIINKYLIKQFKIKGAKIDALYYCPHHPEKNHPEANNPKYRKECECRKPNIGMIKEATKKFGINTNESYVVGDRTI